jgi:putative Ig domain-containing protein
MARRVPLVIAAFSLLVPAFVQAASVTLDWDRNTDSVTAGYYVYYGTEPGKYSGNVDVGSSTSAVVNLNDPTATYYFAVQAYSATGERSLMSAEVMFKQSGSSSPQAPTLLNPGSMTAVVGQSVNVQLRASDPAGLALAYSVSGLPSGLVLGATGVIFGTPNVPGAYYVTISVTNSISLSASQTFTWTILSQPSSTVPGGGLPGGGGTTTGGGGSGTGGGGTIADPGFIGGTPSGGGTPTAPSPVPPPDLTPPIVFVSSPSPAGGSSRTINSRVIVTGIASDNVGIVSVTWANSRGGSGSALGTSSWATNPIELQMGDNVITITAVDAAGNAQSVTLTVTRYVDLENHLN